jgi:NDP-sugar pyrophosphorylase family protein
MGRNMTIVITMAGLGTRFRNAGYDCPKYQIRVRGKSLFEWSMDSLMDYNGHANRYVFVVRREDHAEAFIRAKCAGYGIRDVVVVELEKVTDGQATTCMRALPYCPSDDAVLVYNIDTYVQPFALQYVDIVGDGHIPCFHAEGDHWSFARLDATGNVAEVREKVRISDNCTLGAYYFASAMLYRELYEEYYTDDSRVEKNEKYIAPLYNLMIRKGMRVTISLIDLRKVHVLGTPEELRVFENLQTTAR